MFANRQRALCPFPMSPDLRFSHSCARRTSIWFIDVTVYLSICCRCIASAHVILFELINARGAVCRVFLSRVPHTFPVVSCIWSRWRRQRIRHVPSVSSRTTNTPTHGKLIEKSKSAQRIPFQPTYTPCATHHQSPNQQTWIAFWAFNRPHTGRPRVICILVCVCVWGTTCQRFEKCLS